MIISDPFFGDVVINANSNTFTYGDVLIYGDSYDVSVKTQPIGYTCDTLNPSGVATGNVENIIVSCALSNFTLHFSKIFFLFKFLLLTQVSSFSKRNHSN